MPPILINFRVHLTAAGGPLYAPRTAGRPYDTVIGLVSCEPLLLLFVCVQAADRKHGGLIRPSCPAQVFGQMQADFQILAPCHAPVGDDCDVLYNRTRFGPPGAYTNVAQLRPWVDANLACLAQGQACPWGGTW